MARDEAQKRREEALRRNARATAAAQKARDAEAKVKAKAEAKAAKSAEREKARAERAAEREKVKVEKAKKDAEQAKPSRKPSEKKSESAKESQASFAPKEFKKTNSLVEEIRQNPIGKGKGTKGEFKAIGAVMAAEQKVISARGRTEKKSAKEGLKQAEKKAVSTLSRGERVKSQPRDARGRWVKA